MINKIIASMLILFICACTHYNEQDAALAVYAIRVHQQSVFECLEQGSDSLDNEIVSDENEMNVSGKEKNLLDRAEADSNTSMPPTDDLPENDVKENKEAITMKMTIGNQSFNCTLYDNETVRAFLDQLPLSITMSELNGNEKYYYLEEELPVNALRPGEIHAGELMLYGTDCLVLFYDDLASAFSYTSIGYIDEQDQLAVVLGEGSVQILFSAD